MPGSAQEQGNLYKWHEALPVVWPWPGCCPRMAQGAVEFVRAPPAGLDLFYRYQYTGQLCAGGKSILKKPRTTFK